ncbi:MAG: hypothetical protein LBL07_03860, partial [Tannerella sp.]|nr:hypothetical protein [Tannerella sp.]
MKTETKEDKKIAVNFPEGTNFAEMVLREGPAIGLLDPRPPVKTKLSGIISVPAEYLKKRVKAGQFTQERSHLIVNREEIHLSLIINEDDEYLRGQIDGTL